MGDWLQSHGRVIRVGVEGAGSYGASLARHLVSTGVEVVEVNRTNRQLRRLGKTDATDAQAAARAALNGQATGCQAATDPSRSKSGCSLLLPFRDQSTTSHNTTRPGSPPTRSNTNSRDLPPGTHQAWPWFRPRTDHTTVTYAKKALRTWARRHQTLTTEIDQLCARANPTLLATPGIGPDTAATLLITAGDNPQRMRSEASFAALCGASPVQASSGRTIRHRLNRGGNRQRQRSTPSTPKPPHHPHPGRHSRPNPPKPHLTTRTRPLPQPPPRHPIPTMAHHPHTTHQLNLTTIGASKNRFTRGLLFVAIKDKNDGVTRL